MKMKKAEGFLEHQCLPGRVGTPLSKVGRESTGSTKENERMNNVGKAAFCGFNDGDCCGEELPWFSVLSWLKLSGWMKPTPPTVSSWGNRSLWPSPSSWSGIKASLP